MYKHSTTTLSKGHFPLSRLIVPRGKVSREVRGVNVDMKDRDTLRQQRQGKSEPEVMMMENVLRYRKRISLGLFTIHMKPNKYFMSISSSFNAFMFSFFHLLYSRII